MCEFPGCPDKHDAKGLCKSHYNQRAKGRDLTPIARDANIAEYFWRRVEKGDDCWPWTGAKALGYGRIKYKGIIMLAHRYSYELAVEPIPEGGIIDHICRNRACVNPSHLRVATHSQNMQNLGNSRLNNKSGARNVYWKTDRNKWRVRVAANGKKHHGGDFHNIEDAIKAAEDLRRKLHS